jgi:hypothetical protein
MFSEPSSSIFYVGKMLAVINNTRGLMWFSIANRNGQLPGSSCIFGMHSLMGAFLSHSARLSSASG